MESELKSKLTTFKIVGLFPTEEYQKCKYYANYLHAHLPQIFDSPKFRPMFDIQWTDYLIKLRRDLGVRLWKLNVPVAVFKDGEYFGNDVEFVLYCNVKYRFHAFEDFNAIGKEKLLNYIRKNERPHVYLTISIDDEVIGTLLIMLYVDLVPLTCVNFLRLIKKKKRGYKKAPIHRIVKTAWIQCGGYELSAHTLECENYIIPHDQRGVLSMCHNGKHTNNSMQFFISMQKCQWMDYYYVAFGQVLHGEDILKKIEETPTHLESPEVPIIIEDCGEYLSEKPFDKNFTRDWGNFIGNDEEKIRNFPDDISDFRDVDSFYSTHRFEQGLYSIDVDDDKGG